MCLGIGLPVLGEIDEPGFLEGGDYFAAGEDLALVGVGLRSNMEACEQLMDRNWLGTDRLAVVRDDFEQHQVSSLSFCFNSVAVKAVSMWLCQCQLWLPLSDVCFAAACSLHHADVAILSCCVCRVCTSEPPVT